MTDDILYDTVTHLIVASFLLAQVKSPGREETAFNLQHDK